MPVDRSVRRAPMAIAAALLTLLVVGAAPAATQPDPGYHVEPLPAGPVGDRLRQVVEVVGSADLDRQLGSMNKKFTAVAVGQLVEPGKLAWDDPVAKYLGEDWLPRADAEKIEIRHLLSHTSGLGSHFNASSWPPPACASARSPTTGR